MANSYKNITITPYRSDANNDPKINFAGANTTVNTDINLYVYPLSNGSLSFEGSAGQLFSITNDLSGTIYSVNDVSGIPSLEVLANGVVRIAQYSGNVGIGGSDPSDKFQIYAKDASVDFSGRVDSATAGHRPSFRFIHTGGSLTTASPTDARLGLVSFLGVSSSNSLSTYAFFDAFLSGAPTAGSESAYIRFQTTAAGTSAERMRIDANGNIGINGTGINQNKLHVNGNVSVTGAITENVFTITDGASVDINPTNGTIQTWTLGANRTPTANNFSAGQSVTLMILDGTAYTITWSTINPTWVGGTAPTLDTTKYTVIELWKVSTTVYGALVGYA